MKRILALALLLFLVGCTTDSIDQETSTPETTPEVEMETPVTEQPDTEVPDTEEPDTPVEVPTEMMDLTLEELAMYNGVDMDKMYIAVNGVIYDVTNEAAWEGGSHQGLMVGMDVTEGFMMSPHSEELLAEMVMVGHLLIVYDLEMLSMYNGVEMPEMYIAVNGFVYDVTNEAAWEGGSHQGLMVGKDVTEGFMMSPHSEDLLAEMMKVGVLEVMTFTLEELGMYNGVDMDMMYIAVDGIVYDVTDVAAWSSGSHQGYDVGTDVTEGFEASPHAMATLDDLVIVGILIN